ncbi:hypothetical protein QZH41_011966, partial [Actinostola sp. cb2023]
NTKQRRLSHKLDADKSGIEYDLDDDDDKSMATLYGARVLLTPTKDQNKPPNSDNVIEPSKLKTTVDEATKSLFSNQTFEVTDAVTTTPITPHKTPIKEYDRHLITDMSLVTPTKNSPNTSRNSLMGAELDVLMDGVEWSPIPKKTLTWSKLFEEYSPHSSPYCRFLVLEVYRREASTEEAVAKYGRVLSEKVVRLFDESQSVERYCYLRQDWEMTEVETRRPCTRNRLDNSLWEFDMTSGICILDNQTDQYIVVHPDTLVSGTTVAGATRCLRRSILNERFRTEDTNEAMLIGTLLHDLFDKAMQSKGKVDATVEVKIDRRPKIHRHRPDTDNSVETCVVPLELKTGKLLSKLGSVDHRAQVILYTLLLSDRHRHPVDSGVLYYMKSTHMIGIPALVHEKRALIMSRNEVARYLSPGRMTSGRQMPGMLKETHTCSRCSQAQNCTLFHKSVENGDRVTSGIGDTFDKLTQHLTSDHTRFFAHWFKLVCLEGKEVQQSSKTSQHHIWSMKGLDREALGQCISGLVLTSHDIQMENDNMYMHKFERSADHPSQTPLVELPLSTGERVVISEEQNNVVAIATGK